MDKKLQKNVESVERQCHRRKISPKDAVEEINELLGGISRVEYKEGKMFNVFNGDESVSLSYNGVRKKAMKYVHHMACLAYQKAKDNGNFYCGQVHISDQISSKHHKDGLNDVLQLYAN